MSESILTHADVMLAAKNGGNITSPKSVCLTGWCIHQAQMNDVRVQMGTTDTKRRPIHQCIRKTRVFQVSWDVFAVCKYSHTCIKYEYTNTINSIP